MCGVFAVSGHAFEFRHAQIHFIRATLTMLKTFNALTNAQIIAITVNCMVMVHGIRCARYVYSVSINRTVHYVCVIKAEYETFVFRSKHKTLDNQYCCYTEER